MMILYPSLRGARRGAAFSLSALALAGLLAAAPVRAETSAPAPAATWTFEALLRETETTHPALAARARARDAAQAEVTAAKWQRYPTPGVEAGFDDDGNRETVVFVQQPLWTGGRITAGIDAAEARYGAAGEDVSVKRREVLLRLIDAYVDARRRQAQQRIYQQNVQQHERLLEMIERRVGREVSPKVDQDLARSRLYQAANDLSQVVQALSDARTRLAELSGRSVAEVAESEAGASSGLPGSRAEALERAAAVSPLLERLTFERSAADADVRSERAAFWPKLSLRVEHRDNEAQRQLNQRDTRALLQLESQFGAGLSAGSRVDAAIARREALAEERRAALRELESEVGQSWNQLTAARLRLDNSRINRDSARLVFESYTRQYVVGQKSWLDVLNAVREASAAAVTVEDAGAETLRAELRLRLLTGGL